LQQQQHQQQPVSCLCLLCCGYVNQLKCVITILLYLKWFWMQQTLKSNFHMCAWLQVLCMRCSGLCNGAMIPAVEDFTQKAWAQQQAALLQQPAAAAAGVEEPIPTDSEYEGAATEVAAAAAGDGQLELLGKLLVTPEQLRQKISVSAGCW
jgi:hypothetical protein